MEYRQTKVAYVVSYIAYRWILGWLTLGIVPVVDYMKYKRHALSLQEKSLVHSFGIFTQNSREVFYRNIQGVNVRQSVLGQLFNYGDILVTTANRGDSIVFNKVDNPQILRQAIQDKIQ